MSSIRAAAVLIMLAAPGCRIDVSFDDSAFACQSSSLCPLGYECRAMRCVPSGRAADSGVGSDGAPDVDDDVDASVAPIVPAFEMPTANLRISGSAAGDDDESFTADQLFVIFNSTRDGGSNLFSSTRPSVDAEWPTPAIDAQLSSASSDGTVAVSANGLFVLFASDRPGGVGLTDLYLASRTSRAQPFEEPLRLAALSGPTNDLASWISDDGRELIMHSDRTGDYDIYTSKGDPLAGVYDPPSPLAELNVPGSLDASARLWLVVWSFRFTRTGRVAWALMISTLPRETISVSHLRIFDQSKESTRQRRIRTLGCPTICVTWLSRSATRTDSRRSLKHAVFARRAFKGRRAH